MWKRLLVNKMVIRRLGTGCLSVLFFERWRPCHASRVSRRVIITPFPPQALLTQPKGSKSISTRVSKLKAPFCLDRPIINGDEGGDDNPNANLTWKAGGVLDPQMGPGRPTGFPRQWNASSVEGRRDSKDNGSVGGGFMEGSSGSESSWRRRLGSKRS